MAETAGVRGDRDRGPDPAEAGAPPIGIEHIIPTELMVAKIEEAVAARRSRDFLLIGRTNALRTHDLDEALRRGEGLCQGRGRRAVRPGAGARGPARHRRAVAAAADVHDSGRRGWRRPGFRWRISAPWGSPWSSIRQRRCWPCTARCAAATTPSPWACRTRRLAARPRTSRRVHETIGLGQAAGDRKAHGGALIRRRRPRGHSAGSPAAAVRMRAGRRGASGQGRQTPSLPRDHVDRMPPLFHHQPRGFDAQVLHRLGRRLARLGVNARLNCRGLRCAASASCSTESGGVEVALGIGQRALDAVGFGLHLQQRRKLRLPARAPVIDDELLRDRPRHLRAPDPSRPWPARGRRPAVIPADVQTGPSVMKMRSSSTFTLGETRLKLARVEPMRGRAPALEQAGFGENERADAGRGDPPGSPRRRPHEREKTRPSAAQ